MSREIRITVDDDEVFERMKRRKQQLDLSWEEVLHRGLRQSSDPEAPRDSTPSRDAPRRPDDRPRSGREAGRYAGERDRWGALADDLESEIQDRVYDALQSSFGAAGVEVAEREELGNVDEFGDVDELQSAEDATLVFEFLDDRPDYRVPLRVNLRTSHDGIDVEVVAVRQGKNVSHTNQFEGGARKRVNARLASGDLARLRFDDATEEYAVRPMLSWGRDQDGRPTVSEVEIDEVVLDDDQ